MTAVFDLACELLALPSITPNDHGCQLLISQRLAPLGFVNETLSFDEVTNLWSRYGKEGPLLVFAGHTDVVPTGPLTKWSHPPFTPSVKDGLLFARGACDMKAGIAAMVVAAEQFVKKHPHFPGSIAFLLTSDEEGPAINGTQKVLAELKKRQIHIDYAIVGEPSSHTTVGDQIRIGRRGSLHGKLCIYGKQGHVAHPHLAINAIHLAAPALAELSNLDWDQGNDDFPPTTFQITNIAAGTGALNIVPGEVEIHFNLRFSPESSIASIQARTDKILQQLKLTYDLTWQIGAQPFLTKKAKLLSATVDAIKTCTGQETKQSTGGGTSDARFIAPTGAEVIELGVSHATAHHVDEHVNIEEMDTLVNIYTKMLENLFLS